MEVSGYAIEMLLDSPALVLPDKFQQPQISFTSALRGLLFRACAQHQTSIKKSKVQPSLRTWLRLLFLPVQTAQLLSLVLQHLKQVQDYATYAVVEQALRIVRPDRWMEGLGAGVCIGVAAALVYLTILLVLQLLLAQSPSHANLHPAVLLSFSLPLAAIHKYLWLPLLSLLFTNINSTLVLETDSEYVWMGVASAAEIALLGAFLLLYICFLHEDAWSLHTEHPTARPDSTYEVRELAVLSCFSALPVLPVSAPLSLVLHTGLAGYLCAFVLWYLPYYSTVVLLGRCMLYGLVSWAAVCALIGVGTDSMTVTVKLFLFVAPCILLLLCHLLMRRKGLIRFRKAKPMLWKYELMVRTLLEANADPGEVALAEAIAYGTRQFAQKERRFFLFVGQYYYYVRGLPEIALVRLSQGTLCPPDVLAEFQIYRFSEALYRVSRSEEREFVEYERRYQSCMQQDCALCEISFDLLSSVLNKSTTGPLLERALVHLAHLITGTNQTYRKLKQRFPTDPFVLESYGSYLDLFHKSEAMVLKTSGILERNKRKKTSINEITSYSSEDTGVMIVSCQKELLGKVVFANAQMSGVLGGKIQDIVGKDLDDFIPPPYNFNHNFKLQSFLHHGEAKEISRSHLFLTSLTGFSVEVTFRFRPTVVAGVPYFLVAARQKPRTREFAIYGEDGKVTSHSQGFPGKLGLERKWIVGDSLETLFPGVSEKLGLENVDESPFPYPHPTLKDTLWLKLSCTGLGHSFIHSLYLLTSSQGIEDLFHSSTGLGYSRFRRSLRATSNSDLPDISADPLKPGEMADSDGAGKDTGLRETRDEATGVTSTSTSYGRSEGGLKVREKALSAGRTLKLASLGLIILMTVLLAVVLGVLWATFQDLTPNSTTEIGAIRLHFLKIAHITRRLDLISHGYEAVSARTPLQQALEAEVSSLSAAISLLDSVVAVSVVTCIEGKFSYLEVPLKTALTDYNTHARLQGGADRGEAADVFYTYYNGVGPLLKEVNRTVEEEGDAERSRGLQVIGATVGLGVGLMAIGIICACFVIVRSLLTLHLCYSRLWQTITTLPVSKARDIMNTHKNRIEVLHGVEHVAPDQGKIRENRSMAKPPVRWTLLLGKCLLLVLCSCAFTTFLGVYGYGEVQRLLWTNMRYINTVSYLTVLPTLTLHTLKELSLWQQGSPISYLSLVPEAQSIPSLSLLLSTHLASLSSTQLSVLQDLDSMATQARTTGLDLAFSSACPYLNGSQCEGSLLDRGEVYGVSEWGLGVVDLQRRVEEGEKVWEQLVALETSMEMLTDATVALQRDMQKYAETANTQFTSDMLTYACIYVICTSLVYALISLPLVEGLKKKCEAAWRVTTLVRNDYVARKA